MIPIVINNRNRLTTTRKLVSQLKERGYDNIVILDNDSTYTSLLEWYKECGVRVKYLGKNLGQLAIYNGEVINEFKQGSWVAYTDSDILLGDNCPSNFIEVMIEKAAKYSINKVGLAIKIDDLPNTEYANWVRSWESKYWEKKLHNEFNALGYYKPPYQKE